MLHELGLHGQHRSRLWFHADQIRVGLRSDNTEREAEAFVEEHRRLEWVVTSIDMAATAASVETQLSHEAVLGIEGLQV
jgi:hypothetical protein